MKLSIITPTYNSEITLSIALESVLNQTFVDFEILIIDGKSSDATLSIIKAYANKDKRINWISKQDKGIYDAMNKGVKLSKGEWIYFLGSDDAFINRNVLTNIFTKSEISKFDVVYGNVLSSRFNGRYDGKFEAEKLFNKNICHQAIFFKRNVFKRVGLFNIKYKSHADWDHNLRWFLSKKIKKKYLPYDIANYGDGGFSSLNNDKIFMQDKSFNYIKYGFSSLSNKVLWQLTYHELREAYSRKRFIRIPFVLFVYLRSKLFYKCLKLS